MTIHVQGGRKKWVKSENLVKKKMSIFPMFLQESQLKKHEKRLNFGPIDQSVALIQLRSQLKVMERFRLETFHTQI